MFAYGAVSILISIDRAGNNNILLNSCSLLTAVNESRLLSRVSAAVVTEGRIRCQPCLVEMVHDRAERDGSVRRLIHRDMIN